MKQILAFLFCLLAGTSFIQAEGIEFFKGTWDEALEMAAEEEKIIFVDAYTTWCGPCKRMDKNIFPLEEVGNFYNTNFVNVKLDMEKGEGLTFRSKYRVNSFPTFLFIDATGKAVLTHIGGLPADRFINLGKNAMSKIDYSVEYAAKYEEGDRTPDLLYNYAMSLVKSKKPSLKVANEYLRTQDDMTNEKNLKFIYSNTIEADSRIFDLMVDNKKAIEALMGKEKVIKKIEKACEQTVTKAIEFESDFLLDEAKEKARNHCPETAEELAASADLHFNLNMGNADEFIKAAEKFFKKTTSSKTHEMSHVSLLALEEFSDNEKVMQSAEKWTKKAASDNDSGHLYNYAVILLHNGKDSQALDTAKKALKIATEKKKPSRKIVQLISEIESKA
ncbi:MAG: thioredoxin family protein [Bacteroidota bacterium]